MKNRALPGLLLALGLMIHAGVPTGAMIPAEMHGETEQVVYPGGMPFGVKFFSDGPVIVGFAEVPVEGGSAMPAYDAGLRVNDRITRVNGREVNEAADVLREITGAPIEITYARGNTEGRVVFTPIQSKEDGKFKTGMWLRDTTAGIGTVTYIIPETGEFGGLGHGICDPVTGEPIQMNRGMVMDVEISGIQKGRSGAPGELQGELMPGKTGVLLGNTMCGVYGVLGEIPYGDLPQPALPVADRSEVTEGTAWIWSTLDDNVASRYEIEILRIDQESEDYRNFEIQVTDATLIERTGGIVQGMSGSPIIQNGKLVGAVTHVMVNDPTRGYGIFIENMLNAAG